MQRLAERQRDFAEALLNPELPAPPGLVGPNGGPSSKRFAVYRNNVVAGLTETPEDAFPPGQPVVGGGVFPPHGPPAGLGGPPRAPLLPRVRLAVPGFLQEI